MKLKRMLKNQFLKISGNKNDYIDNNISEVDEDFDEAEEYAKETMFGGFWKTMGKLLDKDYLK